MDSEKTPKQVYTPHLKKVLRSFQASANTSLHGPNSVMGLWRSCAAEASPPAEASPSVVAASSTTTTTKPLAKTSEDEPFTAPPPFPIQQPPIFTPPDQSGFEKSETVLENETISCFTVGGEKRLCLPQILNTVLRDFSLQQINCVCDNLHIFCSRCTAEQLEVLKNTNVLPLSAPSCGLITKSDAERLCAALLDTNPPKLRARSPDEKPLFQVRIQHECFGRCSGLYAPDLYLDPAARCIECTECHGLFSPQKFVCHAHHPKENRTCHWGFDSFNWRFYLSLEAEVENEAQMKDALKEMKSRYDYSPDYHQKYKRKQVIADSRDPSKKIRVENFYPYPYALDPGLVYWYSSPAWSKVAAFKPLPPVITSDEKPILIHPDALPNFYKERSPYFLSDPSFLQASDHVLPLPQSERYETHYHASVAYGPTAVHKLGLKPYVQEDPLGSSRHESKAAEKVGKKYLLKKEPNTDVPCCLEPDDVFSDTSSSTLSAGADESLLLACDEEELSPVETELQPIASLLSESGVDSMTCTKVVAEVEGIVSKYHKCLKASIQKRKLMQTEFEKQHNRQREKIRKLKERRKCLEKAVMKMQSEAPEPESSKTACPEKASPTVKDDSPTTDALDVPVEEPAREEAVCEADDNDEQSSPQPNKSPDIKTEVVEEK